jgi:hypothetical protein
MKTFSGFLSASQMTSVPVRLLERLASWASRYGMVCRPLRPFTHELYAAQHLTHRDGSVQKSPDLAAIIDLWIATLTRLELHRAEFSRPLDSIATRSPTWHFDFDASLTGIGILLYYLPDSATTPRFAVRIVFPFSLGADSSYQNSVEFLAVVVGLGILACMGFSGCGVSIRGDSTTALSWSSSERFKAGRSQRSALAFMHICTDFDIQVSEREHIAGTSNSQCDGLSRDTLPVRRLRL